MEDLTYLIQQETNHFQHVSYVKNYINLQHVSQEGMYYQWSLTASYSVDAFPSFLFLRRK